MRDYFDDEEEFDDELNDLKSIIMEKEKMKKEKEDFINNCKEAYQAIQEDPDSVFSYDEEFTEQKKGDLIKAINRMSGLFILEESYEKCAVLKEFLKKRVPDAEFTPRTEEVKKFLAQ